MAKRVRGLKAVSYRVEEHDRTAGDVEAWSEYATEAEAIRAMCEAKARNNGATCIARNRNNTGRMFTLGLV